MLLSRSVYRQAAEGIQLERYYTFKFCSPTRSSFLSGRLPIHVNEDNNPSSKAGGVDPRMYGNFGITFDPFLTPSGHLPARPRRVLCSTSRPWSSGADWCLQPDVVSELGLQVTRGCSPRAASPSCTATSTSFWTIFRAFFCSAPPHTRCEPCSTWCLC